MADRLIEIETNALDADQRSMSACLQTVKNEIRQLIEEMQQLDSMWEGAAKQAFLAQFQNDCAIMEDICTNLTEYLTSMEKASMEYKKCESDVNDLIRSLRI